MGWWRRISYWLREYFAPRSESVSRKLNVVFSSCLETSEHCYEAAIKGTFLRKGFQILRCLGRRWTHAHKSRRRKNDFSSSSCPVMAHFTGGVPVNNFVSLCVDWTNSLK